MAKFNDETPDDDSVKYYSYAASFVPSWSNSYFFSHKIILEREGPNDGVVSVASAKWGEFKGELENVNHLDLVSPVFPKVANSSTHCP
jgi:triacylglycerol lipase